MLSRNRKQKKEKESLLANNDDSRTSLLRGGTADSTSPPPNSNGMHHPNSVPTPQSAYSMPAIYAAPTVDTLDDGSLFMNRAYQGILSTTATNNNHFTEKKVEEDDEQSGVTRHHVSFTPTSVSSAYDYAHYAYSPTRGKSGQQSKNTQELRKTQATATTTKPASQQQQQILKQQRRRKQQKNDFQHEEDVMTVTVRPVNVAQRSAFEWSPLISVEEWRMIAQRLERKSRLKAPNSAGSSSISAHKKLSPSLQHLELLHAMQSMTTIRQLAFSPSCGVDADIFVPWWRDTLEDVKRDATTTSGDGAGDEKKLPPLKRRMSSFVEQRDGRYRSIHPVQATVSALPTVPPALSNKKTRLPMRSDVGFPNASQEEIQQKQMEINSETAWEEASPRLIVLVTSDDLGTAVQEEAHDPIIQPDHLEWNGGGLQGMPWAGKELLRAKELSALHFSRKSSLLSQSKNQNQREEGQSDGVIAVKRRLLEPNHTSVLAPPMDASYSRTLGWRPRPFHDRQPGMEYVLCWPLEVSFESGCSEPLVCSLALYTLPMSAESNGKKGAAFGKMSEDFTFQAGNWDGKIELDPLIFNLPNTKRNNDESNLNVHAEEDLLQAWGKRKQKAIFSYDPLALPEGKESLFWVVQIYRIAHCGSATAYLDGNGQGRRTGSVSKLFKGKSPSKQKSESHLHSQEEGVNNFFDRHGSKFLTPIAYGVTRVFPEASDLSSSAGKEGQSIAFPKGCVENMTLFPVSAEPESQDDFVQLLADAAKVCDSNGKLSSHSVNASKSSFTNSSYVRSEHSLEGQGTSELASIASSVSDRSIPNTASNLTNSSHSDEKESKHSNKSPPHKKKSIAQRIFKSPGKASRSLTGTSSSSSSHPGFMSTDSLASNRFSAKSNNKGNEKHLPKPLAAKVNLFVSKLSVDFLQPMLLDPTDMDGFVVKQHPNPISQVPKILCDVSGDFAVFLEDNEMDKKRSSLARLPPHRKPAGYIAASEIREILYLPARPEKQYDLDIPSHRSQINLLYLYPRLLRWSTEPKKGTKQKKESRARYTVRVRLVQSSLDVDESSGKVAASNAALDAFHNPTPWESSTLVKELYTKIPSDLQTVKQQKVVGQHAKFEQPMRDEIKLRLPLVLDGSFFLHFTLFEIQPESSDDNSGDFLLAVGENTIPLSSSSMRDTAGGVRVATVIPNGCHRLALGDFKFYVESRLISSVHVGDAAVAAAIRDFPFAALRNNGDGDDGERDAFGSHFKPSSDSAVTFPTMLNHASDGILVGHCQLLLYMHLSNLIDPGIMEDPSSPSACGQFMMGNMKSLFVVFRKVKAFLSTSKTLDLALNAVGNTSRKRLDAFLKKLLDDFDENFLNPSRHAANEIEEERASDMGSEAHDIEEIVDDENEIEGDLLDEGAVRVRHRDSLRSGIDARLHKRGSAGMDITSVSSFSRVAYGASKTDRMKIEAEMFYEGGRLTHLPVFDDDETVVTAGTSLQNISELKRKQMAAAALERQQNGVSFLGIRPDRNAGEFYSDSSIKGATAAASQAMHEQQEERASSEVGFRQKVKTVAQVMLQPCVGPSNSVASPRRLSLDCGRSMKHNRKRTPKNKPVPESVGEKSKKIALEKQPEDVIFPASDLEDEDDDDDIIQKDSRPGKPTPLRDMRNAPTLRISIADFHLDGHNIPLSGARYVYEAIMLLWIRSWFDHKENATNELSGIPIFDATASGDLFPFVCHMDVILPLCLKSLALRHGVEAQSRHEPSERRILLDKANAKVLELFVETLARCVMGLSLSYAASTSEERDRAMLRALASAELVLEFFEGLLAILHPEHMKHAIKKYFRILRSFETESLNENNKGILEFEWTQEVIHRVKSSRQLRLRAVEVLAVLPSFLALNFPLKFSDDAQAPRGNGGANESTWKMQYSKIGEERNSLKTVLPEDGKLPESGWLARLLTEESLSICAISCEAVVAEAMAHIEFAQSHSKAQTASSLRKRPGTRLKRGDLLMFQSLAIHAITSVYELVMRRNAMDRRFQTDHCRGRIAALYAEPLLTQSLQSVRWLARMESTHKVRSLWLLCLIYVLQEVPEVLIRELVRSYCDPSDIRIHRFIRLLRLSSSTFQSFVDQPRHSMFPESIDKGISPWLLQESFNTICATTNIVVEECVKLTAANPREQRKMMHAVLDLLLHVLTTPQSAVTHLRALGGSLQALEEFGAELFLDVVGSNLQHWIRVVQSLMNSTSLSVRSISVDFTLALLGSTFDLLGNVDEVLVVFASVLPEVAAREIGLCSVNGLVTNVEDLERAIWPLRRSFADIEDANPLDDDRIDPELSPLLKTFCRTQQSILDGVLIELRLRKDDCFVVGTKVHVTPLEKRTFDADEESLVEAADFFLPETAPLQRIRWLLTLKSLHEAKGQWIEAAETLIACARTISDALPYLRNVWRPSRFVLWSDMRRSIWLETVGEDMGRPDRGNAAVMKFADDFLEPVNILGTPSPTLASGKLQQPSVAAMCNVLTAATKEAVKFYLREDGMDEIAYARLENLLQTVMNVLVEHGSLSVDRSASIRSLGTAVRRRHVEEEAALRRVSASLSHNMTRLAERLLLVVQDEPETPDSEPGRVRKDQKFERGTSKRAAERPFYVIVAISGSKPNRFQESTTLPTYLDWGMPCVCRVPRHLVDAAREAAGDDIQRLEKHICLEYGRPLQQAIRQERDINSVVLSLGTNPDSTGGSSAGRDPCKTYLDISLVHVDVAGLDSEHFHGKLSTPLQSKRFFYKKSNKDNPDSQGHDDSDKPPQDSPGQNISTLVEVTVARTFPCVLSRQRTLLTSEILSVAKF